MPKNIAIVNVNNNPLLSLGENDPNFLAFIAHLKQYDEVFFIGSNELAYNQIWPKIFDPLSKVIATEKPNFKKAIAEQYKNIAQQGDNNISYYCAVNEKDIEEKEINQPENIGKIKKPNVILIDRMTQECTEKFNFLNNQNEMNVKLGLYNPQDQDDLQQTFKKIEQRKKNAEQCFITQLKNIEEHCRLKSNEPSLRESDQTINLPEAKKFELGISLNEEDRIFKDLDDAKKKIDEALNYGKKIGEKLVQINSGSQELERLVKIVDQRCQMLKKIGNLTSSKSSSDKEVCLGGIEETKKDIAQFRGNIKQTNKEFSELSKKGEKIKNLIIALAEYSKENDARKLNSCFYKTFHCIEALKKELEIDIENYKNPKYKSLNTGNINLINLMSNFSTEVDPCAPNLKKTAGEIKKCLDQYPKNFFLQRKLNSLVIEENEILEKQNQIKNKLQIGLISKNPFVQWFIDFPPKDSANSYQQHYLRLLDILKEKQFTAEDMDEFVVLAPNFSNIWQQIAIDLFEIELIAKKISFEKKSSAYKESGESFVKNPTEDDISQAEMNSKEFIRITNGENDKIEKLNNFNSVFFKYIAKNLIITDKDLMLVQNDQIGRLKEKIKTILDEEEKKNVKQYLHDLVHLDETVHSYIILSQKSIQQTQVSEIVPKTQVSEAIPITEPPKKYIIIKESIIDNEQTAMNKEQLFKNITEYITLNKDKLDEFTTHSISQAEKIAIKNMELHNYTKCVTPDSKDKTLNVYDIPKYIIVEVEDKSNEAITTSNVIKCLKPELDESGGDGKAHGHDDYIEIEAKCVGFQTICNDQRSNSDFRNDDSVDMHSKPDEKKNEEEKKELERVKLVLKTSLVNLLDLRIGEMLKDIKWYDLSLTSNLKDQKIHNDNRLYLSVEEESGKKIITYTVKGLKKYEIFKGMIRENDADTPFVTRLVTAIEHGETDNITDEDKNKLLRITSKRSHIHARIDGLDKKKDKDFLFADAKIFALTRLRNSIESAFYENLNAGDVEFKNEMQRTLEDWKEGAAIKQNPKSKESHCENVLELMKAHRNSFFRVCLPNKETRSMKTIQGIEEIVSNFNVKGDD